MDELNDSSNQKMAGREEEREGSFSYRLETLLPDLSRPDATRPKILVFIPGLIHPAMVLPGRPLACYPEMKKM